MSKEKELFYKNEANQEPFKNQKYEQKTRIFMRMKPTTQCVKNMGIKCPQTCLLLQKHHFITKTF